ncbi:hypothetical protein [Ramlibacter albus]|uniref:BIG2 domain-containing protein n=1 Tax=Ramlibacter albus TaxID=2079448 RepID=A0A923M6T1_9BURK|nr:hypothetical protein [Ramlibacter albus]MBC5764836.1 hypothetical protein [Ramlibacter albus]
MQESSMRHLSSLVLFFVTTFLAACGGGGGSSGATVGGQALFTTAPSALNIGIGSTQAYTVGGGQAPYTATSSNTAVVVPTLSGGTLTLAGASGGSATVTIRDAAGTNVATAVTVAAATPLAVAIPSGTILPIGTTGSQTYTVTGGVSPYNVVSSNPSVLSASVSGNKVTLTGLAAGSATIQITDSANASVTAGITVSASTGTALFTTAPSTLTVSRGTAPTYTIGGGTAPYTATSSNTGVLNVAVSGTTLTLTPVGNGSASIVVRDAAGGTTTIAATVASAPITLNPTAYTAFVGDVLYSVIQGGVGPYSAISGFPDVAEATIGTLSSTGVFTANPLGNIVRIRVKQAVGSGSIIVSDSTGSTANISLTASAATNAIALSPSTLSISEAYAGTIQLMLYGANGTTNIFSTHPGLIAATTPVTGSSSGTAVTLTKSAATVCGGDLAVTISAVDQNGAVGRSTITVVNSDNSVCPP